MLVLSGCPRETPPADSAHASHAEKSRSAPRAASPEDMVPAEAPPMHRIVAKAKHSVAVGGVAAAAAARVVPRDVNLDGRSDMVWHNVNSGDIYF